MPDRRGHLASRRSDLQVALVGLLLAILVGLAGLWTMERIEAAQRAPLRDATDRLSYAVARAVADTVQRGLEYGIPFDQLYGVAEYLDEVLSANPEIAAIWIRDPDGRVVYGVGRKTRMAHYGPSAGSEVGVWVSVEQRRVVQVTLEAAGQEGAHVVRHQYALVLACALAACLGAAVIMRVRLVEIWDLPRAHLMASLQATARGVFADFSRIRHNSPVAQISHLAATARAPVRAAARDVAALGEELHSIDIDGSLGPQVDRVQKPLFRRYSFERPTRLDTHGSWSGWPNLVLVMAATLSIPLISGFAADRVGFGLLSAGAAGGALALEALGGLLGLLAARPLQGRRLVAPLVFLVLVLGGVATIEVAELRDLTPFLALRFGAAFSLYLAIGTLLPAPARSLRMPWFCGLLAICALSLGPLLGSLLADALGRRNAFAAAGIVLLLVALPASLQRVGTPQAGRRRPHWPSVASLAATTTCLTAVVPLYLGAVSERHDYSVFAAFFGLAGAAFGCGLVLARPLVAPALALLAAAAVWLPLADHVSMAIAITLLGLGLGTLAARRWRFATGTGGLCAGLAGGVLGPAVTVGALYSELSAQAWSSFLMTMAALAFLWSLLAGRRGGAKGA